MSNTNENVPYRRMPLGYLAVWVLLAGIVVFYQEAQRHPQPFSLGEVVENATASLICGAFWGWVFWRWVGLYKSF